MAEELRCERDGHVAWLTLSRPDRLNALSLDLLARLGELLAELGADAAVRAVVLRGAGRCFSVGADVADFERLRTPADRRRYLESAVAVMEALAAWPKPTLASVHGLALGGGCELALCCDLVVAGPSARFALPEARLGVIPAFALTLGRARLAHGTLAQLAFTGRRLDAAAAHRVGLVDVLADADDHGEAGRLAREIAANAPLAVQASKRLLHDRAGVAAAIDAAVAALGSEDHATGVAAFRRREAPAFEGR